MVNINIGEAVSQGWSLARKKPFTLFFSAAIPFIYNWGTFLLLKALNHHERVQYFLGITFFLIFIFFVAGLLRSWIAVADNKKSAFKLFLGGSAWFKLIFGGALYILIVTIGIYLLIIPGIYWAVKYQFIFHLIADGNISVFQAFKKSARMTKEKKWRLIFFGAALSLINMGGLLCFGVGFIITSLWTAVAYAWMYRQLSDQDNMDSGAQKDVPIQTA